MLLSASSCTKAMTVRSLSLVLDFQTPQIAKTIGRPNGTSCQLPCRWSKFVDGKSRDNTPPPTIFPETHNRWKG